jgi:hypothetical protein
MAPIDLIPVNNSIVTSRAPQSSVSPAQVAAPYQELANNLNKIGEVAEVGAENAAEQAGANAVTRAPDGSLQVQKPAFPIIGPASQTFARAARFSYLAQAQPDIENKLAEGRIKYENDPEGFKQWSQQYGEELLAKQTDPTLRGPLQKIIADTSGQYYRGLLSDWTNTQNKNANTGIQVGIQSARDDLVAMARGGKTSGPEWDTALDKVKTLTAERVANPSFGYPQAQADYDLQQLDGELRANTFLHHVNQTYQNASSKADGARDALAEAQTVLTDPSLKLTPQLRQQFYSKAVGEIHAQEAIRRQDIGDARASEQALRMQAAYGVKLDPADVESVANGYKAAGSPGDVARLYAWAARAPLGDDFGRQPLAAQAQQIRGLGPGAALATSPSEVNLISHESGGNPRLVNKLGFAGTYQFGAPLLTDLGLYTPGAGENVRDRSATGQWSGAKWSGTFNIPGFPQVKTLQDFLNDPQAQKAAFDIHSANMDKEIASNGLDKYIGQTVGGVPITREGLHMMIHLGGVEGAARALASSGAVNPADANGTSLLHYAAAGATAAQATPAGAMWLQANHMHVLDKTAQTQWKTISEDWDKKGIRPSDDAVLQVVNAARMANDTGLLDLISHQMARVDVTQTQAQQPLAAQQGAITSLEAAGNTGALMPGQQAVLSDLQRRFKGITEGLKQNPISTTVANFGDKFKTPAPLDFTDPNNLAAGLKMRAGIAQFASANWQTGPVSALDQPELQQAKAIIAGADADAKARLFSGLATLPEAVRNATLGKLAEKGGPDVAVGVAAGSMMQSAPDVAQSIVRGQMALKTDKGYWPQKGAESQAATDAISRYLPPTAFGLAARTDPQGAYATAQGMIRARYADLSAQQGDTSGKFNDARLKQATDDVTGGVLYHNGAPLIAPVRGMSQGELDRTISGIKDADLQGVTTLNGQPVTADYLRSNAKLESVGGGRYLIRLGSDPSKPIYAYQGANSEAPQKFVLDLRGRPMADVAAAAPNPGGIILQ